DGHVNVAPIPSMWPRFCKAVGKEEEIKHPDYATREIRRARRNENAAEVGGIIAEMESATLMAKFEAAEVPCGPIYNVEEAYNDPQARHLMLTQAVTGTDGREMTLPRQPFTLSRTPSRLAVRTPEFAEHTDEILGEFGYSAEEIK